MDAEVAPPLLDINTSALSWAIEQARRMSIDGGRIAAAEGRLREAVAAQKVAAEKAQEEMRVLLAKQVQCGAS